MNNNDQKFIAQKIRAQYMEKESTELDALRTLDKKVRRPADVFAYVTGSIGAIVMGAGMSLVMTELGAMLGIAAPLIPGVVIGVVGLAIVLANIPFHKKLLAARRKKYAPEILALSEKLMADTKEQ
ncbi:MAG: dihydropteridine reductase [Ruminococcaceae bacterium]|nr:dihydropteridine reductase [Oscillospiraceae bacterium]